MLKLAHPLILASASPRRLELLAQISVTPAGVVPAGTDETPRKRELPVEYARRVAEAKRNAVAAKHPESLVLAADTVVALGSRILPKAEDEKTAKRCLQLLSGRRHQVHTGVALCSPKGARSLVVTSYVKFKRLEPGEIESYLESGEWRGKAGGYGIQGLAAAFIPWMQGSYSNIVGLPLAETAKWLKALG